MDASTLTARLETATASFRNLERQLADPDVASDPKRLEAIARERSRLEPSFSITRRFSLFRRNLIRPASC